MNGQHRPPGTQATWLPGYAAADATILVLVDRLGILTLPWMWMLLVILVGGVVTFLMTLFQSDRWGNAPGWGRVLFHRMTVVVGTGAWVIWALNAAFLTAPFVTLLAGTVALAVLGIACQSPPVLEKPVVREPEPERDNRHEVIRRWEAIIRSVTGWDVTVTGWEPWEKREDGLRLFVELPGDKGTTAAELAQRTHNLQASGKLPVGCAVEIKPYGHQGAAVIDIMLRNTLVDFDAVHVEPTTPASLTDSFPVITTPRGEVLSICLRIATMVIGGTVGSGKTTLLHRIIMWLARCTDTLIWIIDLNGGGVAEPWINAWATGRADNPVVDWVAGTPDEAAAMVAVAGAIARDRKTNREARRRRHDANSMVLPIDAGMPGIIVLTDEGGELRQASGQFGRLAEKGTARLAQIGRAEGVRLIMSVLRGTADITNKGLRVNAAIRLCLRMQEPDEYGHVLGANPGKVDLGGAIGAGFLMTPDISRPVLGRTVNVDLAGIDVHSVACARLRPALDQWGLAAAAKVTPAAILDGREPEKEDMAFRIMQDAARGEVYTNRWKRYARELAEMRGEDYEEDPADARPDVPAGPLSVLDRLAARVLRTDPAGVAPAPDPEPAQPAAQVVEEVPGGAKIIQMFRERVPDQQPAPADPPAPATAREQIVALVRAAGTRGVSASDLKRQVDAGHSRVFALLSELRDSGELAQNGAGRYVPGDAAPATVG